MNAQNLEPPVTQRCRIWIMYLPVVALGIVMLAGVRGFYFSSDDPGFLFSAHYAPELNRDLLLPVGRWLNLVLLQAGFSFVPALDALIWVRVLSAAGLVCLSLGLGAFLRQLGAPRTLIALAPPFALLTPAMMPILAWAQHVTVVLGAGMALGAFAILVRAADLYATERRMETAARLGVAVILLYLAASINQMLLGFSGTFLFVSVYFTTTRPQIYRRVLASFAVITAAYALSLITVKFIITVPGARASLVEDVMGKLSWFLHEPLSNALFLFAFPPKDPAALPLTQNHLAWTVLALIVIGTAMLRRGRVGDNLLVMLLLIVAIPMAYGPVLATKESWASYRSLWPLQTLLMLAAVCVVYDLVRRITGARMTGALLTLLFATLAVNWYLLFESHIRRPYVQEARYAHSMVDHFFASVSAADAGSPIAIFYPSWQEGDQRIQYYDDIGGPTVRAWTGQPLTMLIAEELGQAMSYARLTPIAPGDRANAGNPSSGLRIDFSDYSGRSLQRTKGQ